MGCNDAIVVTMNAKLKVSRRDTPPSPASRALQFPSPGGQHCEQRS
jgi:hypothetical protein